MLLMKIQELQICANTAVKNDTQLSESIKQYYKQAKEDGLNHKEALREAKQQVQNEMDTHLRNLKYHYGLVKEALEKIQL